MNTRSAIHAAGGVLWRPGGLARRGAVADERDDEVALVHRPRYDDWTFPKGKLAEGERDLDAAVREVFEETGYRVEVGPRLCDTWYSHRGRSKVVHYWAMRAVDGVFVANDEVDALEWLALGDAARRLSYRRDLPVLETFIGCRSREIRSRGDPAPDHPGASRLVMNRVVEQRIRR